jgi:low temperature requirement protein LtrA
LLILLRSAARASIEQETERRLSALVQLVEQWLASYGRVRIYTGVAMLEVSDTNVLREITAYTDLKAQIVQQLQPTLHLIKKDAVKHLIDDMKRHGQSPLVHEEDSYGTE